jgi:hypothetical protein
VLIVICDSTHLTMVDKIEMSLDDIIKSSKQARGPAGRRGRGGQRGSGLSRRGSRGGLRGNLGSIRNPRRGSISRSAPYSRVSFEKLPFKYTLGSCMFTSDLGKYNRLCMVHSYYLHFIYLSHYVAQTTKN